MPTTYIPIATETLSSTANIVTFSSIPSTYTDLVLVVSVKAGTNASANISFNNDTASNYSYTVLDGDGSTASSNRQSNVGGIQLISWSIGMGSTTNFSMATAHIMNYSNSNTFKTAIIRSMPINASNAMGVNAFVGTWRNTAAITTLSIVGTNFTAGSTFSLYGIASAAVVSGAKATGGDTIATDGTYWYHAFRSSGTFTPTQTLSCDVLTIAGGGSTGYIGGGGGAGGLVYTSGTSVSTAQTVTVGAGGAASTQTGNNTGNNGNNSQFGSLTAAIGGGSGGSYFVSTGSNGGSGGGGGSSGPGGVDGAANAGGTATSGQGYNGGVGRNSSDGTPYIGGGGGGAGAAGADAVNNSNAGNGGAGVSTYSSWGIATGTGQNVSGTYWFAGGGAGAADSGGTAGNGGNGGGGAGAASRGSTGGSGNASGVAGMANTGGGGGAFAVGGTAQSGGSGIIIVRYPV